MSYFGPRDGTLELRRRPPPTAATPEGVRSHSAYLRTRRFPALDGLRAVSILLVLAWHTNSVLWFRLHGSLGVIIFFVLSGFLITTLLLREEEAAGRISLRDFYRRRAYRILPVYLLVLAFYVVAVIGLDYHNHRALLTHVLPYYLTFTNDFATFVPSTPFAQSWSLGVEEKFYLAWPLLLMLIAVPRRRGLGVLVLALAPFVFLALGILGRFDAYAAIMVGCGLALALHHRRSYEVVSRLATPRGVAAALGALVVLHLLVPSGRPFRYAYPFAIAAAIVGLVCATGPITRLLESRPARHLGRLSYSVYLVHMIVASIAVAAVRRAGFDVDAVGRPITWAGSLLMFTLIAAGSFALAQMLYAKVEQPWIARGRSSAHKAIASKSPPRRASVVAK